MNTICPIKFRVWNTKKKMFFHQKNDQRLDLVLEYYELNKHVEYPQRYTGLKDKNKKEIYEGDILRTDIGREYENDWEVIFKNAQFSLIDSKRESDSYGVYTRNLYTGISSMDKFEIVGNIYETPELLNN